MPALRSLSTALALLTIAACSTSSSPTQQEPPTADSSSSGAIPGNDGGPSTEAGAPEPTVPSLTSPGDLQIDEETELTLTLPSAGLRRFDAEGLPPGARFDGRTGTLTFRPDFTQSGRYPLTVTGYAGGPPATFQKSVQFTIEVRDSISPPLPAVVATQEGPGYRLLTLRQVTDGFLDSPSNAGRTFEATLSVPTALTATSSAPAQVWLHGLGGAPLTAGVDSYFRLAPHDPESTYWYGYAESGSYPTAGKVPPYTERRVMHLLSWMLATYPQIDHERVFTGGDSMGGAGALTLALRYARHFAGALTTIGQSVPRLHKVDRIATLSAHWGSPASNLEGVWDTLDLTRVLRDDAEARDQFVSTKHGKDDKQILFTAMVRPSPLTSASFYATLESQHIGHLCLWDEGGHGTPDPRLGAGWYDNGWSRMFDPRARLFRNLPFPAFSRSTANDDPGDDQGNGRVTWSETGGFAGNEAIAGDTGWSGAIAGALNRHLRWDSNGIQVSRDRLVLPLFVVTAPGQAPPAQGYPTRGDRYDGALPLHVDVTPRRTQSFQPLPGEVVHWRFGDRSGDVEAQSDGSVTIEQLPLGAATTALELQRDPP